MPAISVERTIGKTKSAVLGGLIGYNTEKMGRQKYQPLRRLAARWLTKSSAELSARSG